MKKTGYHSREGDGVTLIKNKLIYKYANEILQSSRLALKGFIKGSHLQLTPFQQNMFLTGFAGGIISERFSGEDAQLINQIISDKIFVE